MKKRFSAWKKRIPGPYKRWANGILVCCDALDFMKSLRDEIADIVFLDPPFNLGKKYGSRGVKEDLMSEVEYFTFMRDILKTSIRVLKKGGALYFYHIPHWALRFGCFLDTELKFRHWIAISMKSSFVRGNYLYPAHYALLYFTKGNPAIFERPKVPPPTCKKCGEFIRDYGGYLPFVMNGINLSDFWEDLSPVRHKNKKNHPGNELPLELVRRVVQISGRNGGLLVDPFVGSGTSIISAAEYSMRFLACDRETSCYEGATKRLAEYKARKRLQRKREASRRL